MAGKLNKNIRNFEKNIKKQRNKFEKSYKKEKALFKKNVRKFSKNAKRLEKETVLKIKKFARIARAVEITHVFIMIIYIVSVFTMFLSQKYKIYSAGYISLIYIIDYVFGYCPLTILEIKFRKMAQQEIEKISFMRRLFKKHLNLKFSDKLEDMLMFIFFIIAIFIISKEIIF